MHMYSNPSNARAAARKLVEKYPAVIKTAEPIRAPGITPMYYAAVTYLPDVEPSTEDVASIEDKAKVLTAEQVAEQEADAAEAEQASKPSKPTAAPKAKPKAKAKKAGAPKKAPAEKKGSKAEQALNLMRRKTGATAEELIDAMGWLPHTLRGFVSNENRLNSRGIETVRESGKPTRYVLKTK